MSVPPRYLVEWSVHFPSILFDDKVGLWEAHGFDGGPIGFLVIDGTALAPLLSKLGLACPVSWEGPLAYDAGLFQAKIQPLPDALYRVTVIDGFVRLSPREELLGHILAATGRFAGATDDEAAELLAAGGAHGCHFTWEAVPNFPPAEPSGAQGIAPKT